LTFIFKEINKKSYLEIQKDTLKLEKLLEVLKGFKIWSENYLIFNHLVNIFNYYFPKTTPT